MSRVSILLLLLAAGSAHAASAPQSILPNGDFEAGTAGWPAPAGASIETEVVKQKKNHFLRLRASAPGQTINVFRQVPLDGAKELNLTFRVRTEEVKRGPEGWHDARIIIGFKDAAGTELKGGPSHPFFTGTTAGWVEKTLRFTVPSGATAFTIMPAMFQVAGGTMDIDDIVVTAVTPGAAGR
jgi:hypothetical protein